MGFHHEGHEARSAGNDSSQFLAADPLHLPGVVLLALSHVSLYHFIQETASHSLFPLSPAPFSMSLRLSQEFPLIGSHTVQS